MPDKVFFATFLGVIFRPIKLGWILQPPDNRYTTRELHTLT